MEFRHPRRVVWLFGGLLIGMQAAFWLLPRADTAPLEKRVLAEPPVWTAASVADGSAFADAERYVADHFPGRAFWVGAQAYLEQAEGRNAVGDIVRGRDGWLFPAPVSGTDTRTLESNLQVLTLFASRQRARVTLMAVPSAGAVVGGRLPRLHPSYPDAALLEETRRLVQGSMEWVDVYDEFRAAEDPEELYYRTDHHWTSEGAYRAYCKLVRAWGGVPAPQERFAVEQVTDFYGTSYAKSGLWMTPPDTMELWGDPKLQVRTEVYDANRPAAVQQDGLFFRAYLQQPDKYAVFLSGNHARVHIETNAPDHRRLLVIKDSYAHALAPFLAEEFREIDLIDLRYFKRETVSEWLREHPADEILFVYGIGSLTEDKSLQWLA